MRLRDSALRLTRVDALDRVLMPDRVIALRHSLFVSDRRAKPMVDPDAVSIAHVVRALVKRCVRVRPKVIVRRSDAVVERVR